MLSSRVALAIAFLPSLAIVAACPQGDGTREQDAGGSAGAGGADASPPGPQNTLATACTAAEQCASGFCVDGVCCDSSCEAQCLSCALDGAIGHCGPLRQGPDLVSVAPCVGDSSCVLNPVTSQSSCKLIEGATCAADSDCGSGHCLTFYVDEDGDGYGTATTGKFCSRLNASAPAGYASYTGDCCDLDSGANPGFGGDTFLEFPDACGSFDWNCNGLVDPRYAASACPGQAAVACGADCIVNLGIVTFKAFTQACN